MSELNLILLGPPGAGKGTQASTLVEDFSLPYIATGDILRAAMKDGTDLGKEAKKYVEAGELVPDDVIVGVVAERLHGDDTRDGFILDGFPRTLPQAQALENALSELARPLSAVLKFMISDEVAVKRLAGRRSCRRCQRSYNVEFHPSRAEGVCDVCGGELVQRGDDTEDTVRKRLEVYHRSTEPLEFFFWERGLLRQVDADGTEDEVTERAVHAIADIAQ